MLDLNSRQFERFLHEQFLYVYKVGVTVLHVVCFSSIDFLVRYLVLLITLFFSGAHATIFKLSALNFFLCVKKVPK